MTAHMMSDTLCLEVIHMTKLVHLIVSDGLNRQRLLHILQVLIRCNHTSDSAASITYLRSRYELEDHILIAMLLRLSEDL